MLCKLNAIREKFFHLSNIQHMGNFFTAVCLHKITIKRIHAYPSVSIYCTDFFVSKYFHSNAINAKI